MKQLLPYRGVFPKVHPTAFIAPGAVLVGDIEIGEHSTIWYNTAVRADVQSVRMGKFSNIQDGSVVHEDSGRGTGNPEGTPTIIGDYVTVGHNVILHACTIEDYCLVGMGAIVMDAAVIGKGSVIGAGALVTKGTKIPPYSLVLGAPARVVRTLDEESALAEHLDQAMHYYRLAQEHKQELAALEAE